MMNFSKVGHSRLSHSARAICSRHKFKLIVGFAVSFIFLLFLANPTTTYRRFLDPVNDPEPPQIYEEQPKVDEEQPQIEEEPSAQLKVPPPTYESLRRWEDNLPQHNLDLPFPEGKSGRYVKFSNQIVMLGWNNVLNEVQVSSAVTST
ncbi:hypothetical protein C0993_006414 [Termitomyces sp. T159_Od127]|nr:hypothetical protein C0993_006414 [Termitomyces sp. T159_Od127]